MKIRALSFLFAAALLSITACDGGDVVTAETIITSEGQSLACDTCPTQDPPPPTAMSSAMGGSWRGTQTFSQGSVTVTDTRTATVGVALSSSGTTAVVSGSCPGGDGSVTVTAQSSSSGSWSGLYSCAPALFNGCSSATFVYEIVSISLGGDGLLRLNGTGRVTGCGMSSLFYSTSMVGSHI